MNAQDALFHSLKMLLFFDDSHDESVKDLIEYALRQNLREHIAETRQRLAGG